MDDDDFTLTDDDINWGQMRIGNYFCFVVDDDVRHVIGVSGLDYNILIEMVGRNATYDDAYTIEMTTNQYAMFLLKKDAI